MKYFLLIIMGMSIISYAKAQALFAPIGASWHTQNGYHDFLNGYTYYLAEKDTIHDGIDCRKIIRLLVAPDGQGGLDSITIDPLYVYSTADTVFYYNTLFEQFVPLYIFNVSVGMILNYHMPFVTDNMPPDSMFQIHVGSVDEEVIDGITLRKVNGEVVISDDMGMYPDYTYTERLGLLEKQLVPSEESLLGDYFPGKLRCYQDNELVYHADATIACDTISGYTGIAELAQQYKSISIYPNPVQEDWLQVHMNTDPGNVMQIQVYSITGACIMTQLSSDHSQHMRLNVADLPPGIYQLQVNNDGQIIGKGRFVKQ